MHEFSLATELVAQLLRIADERKIVHYTAVVVRCGVLQQVVPEAFAQAFELLVRDTPIAGAKLEMLNEPLAARCRHCGERFTAEIDDYTCPQCGQADVELVAGRDMILQSVTGETSVDDVEAGAAGKVEQP